MTIVDKYIKELSNLGISLKELKVLGDFEFPEEDQKLTEEELIEKILTDENYKEQKELIEKYISEFVRADLITQSTHRRRGEQLINSNNEDWIDGGVFLYRTKEGIENNTSSTVEITEEEYLKTIGDKEYVEMQYLSPTEFEKLVNSQNPTAKYRYTIDEESGELIIANVKGIETITIDDNNTVNNNVKTEKTSEITTLNIDYKKYISKYSLPYEFLISLCEITQNPEFVYHVSLLARETKIILAIQDDTTVEKVTIKEEKKYESYENKNNNLTAEATLTSEKTEKTTTVITTTTTVPHLRPEYANTWSFYEEYEYTINVTENTEENGPITEQFEKGATLSQYQEAGYVTHENPEGGGYGRVTYESEKWYDTFCVETTTTTQTITTTAIYSEGILKNSVEKSKQFLGLLRNKDGECNHDCYGDSSQAKKCAEEAVFDRGGINVAYKIPNATREEMPLNKLMSGEQMLYSILGQNLESDDSLSAEEDYNSQYKTKMSGIIEHIKYLLTFPENEDVEIKYETDEEDQIDIEDTPVQYDDIDEESLEILYRVCQAEAGGSSEAEIGHVACVVLNRVKCSKWGNTVKEVVFQKSQFSCVSNGSYYKVTITEKTKNAVNSILAGGDTTGGAVYFRTEESAKKAGMPINKNQKHKTYIYLFTDPNTHVFLTDQKSLEELRGSTGGTAPAEGKLKDLFPNGIPLTREGIQEYLTTVKVPITTRSGKKTTTSVTIHKGVVDELKSVLQKAQDAGFKVYEVQGFSWRAISGTSKMSQHSLGLAVDINVKENYCVYPSGKIDAGEYWKPGEDEFSIPTDGVLVKSFKAIGWGWGGDWSSKKDYMHFSYTGG